MAELNSSNASAGIQYSRWARPPASCTSYLARKFRLTWKRVTYPAPLAGTFQVPRDLHRIVLAQNQIEDWLIGEPRRKTSHPALAYQRELGGPTGLHRVTVASCSIAVDSDSMLKSNFASAARLGAADGTVRP